MPRFIYKAKTSPKHIREGTIEAESKQQAVTKLSSSGLFPISIEEEFLGEPKTSVLGLGQGVSRREVSTFSRQLSNLLESGLNLLASLNVVHKQITNRYFKQIIQGISEDVKQGKNLSQSLGRFPKVFSPLFVSMVGVGEAGGSLGPSLNRLADFLEQEEDIKTTVVSSMAYPALIAGVGLVTVIVLLTFVIPRLVSMFEDMGQVLPLPTRVLIFLSSLFTDYGWLAATFLCLLGFILYRRSKSPEGRLALDSFKLRFPIWGELIKKTEIIGFCRTLSTLLSNGIPILSSLEIANKTLVNQVLKREVEGFTTRVREGGSLSKAMEDSEYFDFFVANIVSIGEESGTLSKSLMRISDSLQQETGRIIKLFTSLLEPVMILVIGLVLGFIVVSMLLPIFQISFIVG